MMGRLEATLRGGCRHSYSFVPMKLPWLADPCALPALSTVACVCAYGARAVSSAGEQAVCIDHNAALVLPGDGTLRVLAVDGRPGSVDGKPGAMLKRVIEVSAAASEGSSEGGGAGAGAARALKVVSEVLPPLGPLAVLLAPMSEPMVEDPRLEAARAENPSTDLVD